MVLSMPKEPRSLRTIWWRALDWEVSAQIVSSLSRMRGATDGIFIKGIWLPLSSFLSMPKEPRSLRTIWWRALDWEVSVQIVSSLSRMRGATDGIFIKGIWLPLSSFSEYEIYMLFGIIEPSILRCGRLDIMDGVKFFSILNMSTFIEIAFWLNQKDLNIWFECSYTGINYFPHMIFQLTIRILVYGIYLHFSIFSDWSLIQSCF